MKPLRIFGWSVVVWLWAAPASADWTEIRIHQVGPDGIGAEMGVVEAVDSWFTLLATLVFDISGLVPGEYRVWLHDVADCGAAAVDGVVLAGHAAGPVYDRADDNDGAVRGQLGDIVVTPDGEVTRTLSLRPPEMVDGVDKLTVTEMRGRALVIHRTGTGPDTRIACGVIPRAEDDPR
jgi:Cu/Zn superoxide dismutase